MLEKARKVLAQELSYVTDQDVENMESVLDQTCGLAAEAQLVSA